MTRRRLDDNLEVVDGAVRCVHCGAGVGVGDDWLRDARLLERPARGGQPLLPADPDRYVDAPIVVRQAFCPGCLTVLVTEVVPAHDGGRRVKRLAEPITTEEEHA